MSLEGAGEWLRRIQDGGETCSGRVGKFGWVEELVDGGTEPLRKIKKEHEYLSRNGCIVYKNSNPYLRQYTVMMHNEMLTSSRCSFLKKFLGTHHAYRLPTPFFTSLGLGEQQLREATVFKEKDTE